MRDEQESSSVKHAYTRWGPPGALRCPVLSADNTYSLLSWCKKRFVGNEAELAKFFEEVRIGLGASHPWA